MCVAASRSFVMRDNAGVLPVGRPQLGVGLEMVRSFAHAELELKIRDADARIGGVHSMVLQACCQAWGRPARLLHRLPDLGPLESWAARQGELSTQRQW